MSGEVTSPTIGDVGIVAIGRNEGERLRICLAAAQRHTQHVVYVDSGSTDGSVAWARDQGVNVIELDMTTPFTAARARNTGWRQLVEDCPGIRFIHVVDGDCELVEGWVAVAREALEEDEHIAVVCGQRRERHPDRTRYNRLCALEWESPRGFTPTCGGDALFRLAALREVEGYDPRLIAGEEPELCFRLRQRGWKILRLERDMTLHDADITRFGQWWKRAKRAGHAAAEGAWLHGLSPEHYNMKRTGTILFWALMLPMAIVGLAWPTGGLSLLGLGLYPMQWSRIMLKERRRGRSRADARLVATFTLVGKWAQLMGVGSFLLGRLRRQQPALIEYK